MTKGIVLAAWLGGLLLFSRGDWAAKPPAASLCSSDEQVFFNCAVGGRKGPKFVSLCGSKPLTAREGYLQYRFGRIGAPELVFPGRRSGSPKAFRYSRYFRYRVDRTAVSFANQGVEYRVFDDYEGDIEPATHARGVEVTRLGKTGGTAALSCTGAVASRLGGLEGILSCDREDPLNLGNCP